MPRIQRLPMSSSEAGAALLVVVVVLVAVLVGGLAAVAITSGQLAKSRSFRTGVTSRQCAELGLARLRAMLPNVSGFEGTQGQISTGGATLTFRAGHYDGDGDSPYTVLDSSQFDAGSLFSGENIANVLGVGGGDISQGVHMIRATTRCSGTGYGTQEVESVFRYGVPIGVR